MGKSSLSVYLKQILEKKYNMIVLHIANDGIHSVESLITSIIEKLLEEIETESWAKRLLKKFEDNIENVGFLSINIKFKAKEKDYLTYLIINFAEFLKELCQYFEKNKNGLYIIIDDVNGLSESDKFPNWYKSFAKTLDSYYDEHLPLGFILTSYPQNFEKLKQLNPSFTRLFNKIDMIPLSNEEVESFYIKAFDKIQATYDDETLKLIVKHSYGMPLMMQEIGNKIYWLYDEEKHINQKNCY